MDGTSQTSAVVNMTGTPTVPTDLVASERIATNVAYQQADQSILVDPLPERVLPLPSSEASFGEKLNFYTRRVKRPMDMILSILALIVLAIPMGILALSVAYHLGSPVIFKQKRPGLKGKNGKEKIFTLCKFRTMSDDCDKDGNILPDDRRLGRFGSFLRKTSLDELPELWNILRGDMSIVGPRPQLVRDMVFMTEEQRRRHDVRPGLTGWAQVNGRNCISWEDKLKYDSQYLRHVNFRNDWKIIFITALKVIRTESINDSSYATAEDFGDYLLRTGKIDQLEYDAKQSEATELLAADA